MKIDQTTLKKLQTLDTELVNITQDFLLLGPLSWPPHTMQHFLKGVARNNLTLPKVDYPNISYRDNIARLKAYLQKLGKTKHPAITFLRNTAHSYLDAYRILQGVGTKDVTKYSRKLYGSPQNAIPGYKRNHVQVARYFLRVVEEYRFTLPEEPLVYSASDFKRALIKRVTSRINPTTDPISVIIDHALTARAAAGPDHVKIRKGAKFSVNDLNQLFHHEVMTHTLTYINGRKQPLLKSLGYNAPRTTATQEGLAVFAEYMTASIELTRLRRIALRILAIDMAEQGADFIDLFKFYQDHGQNAEESYHSAMRIFRGGKPQGGIIFYKDNVYLSGLIEVRSFFKQMMHEGSLNTIALMFCGKLTTRDIIDLKPLADAGYVVYPNYTPDWAKRSSELAAHLAINDLVERFKPEKKP